MNVDTYVTRVEDASKKLIEVSDLIGVLVEDVCNASKTAKADGATIEERIWDEVSVFLGGAGLGVEEALGKLTLYGQWIRGGALEENVPKEQDVF